MHHAFRSRSRPLNALLALTLLIGCSSSIQPIDRGQRPGRALLLIDLQRGVVDAAGPATLGEERGAALLAAARRAIEAARAEGIPIAFVKNEWPAWRFLENWWFSGAFRKDSEWARIDPRLLSLVPEAERAVFSKAFPSAFSDEGLQPWLEIRQVGELRVGGLFADECVTATSKDALKNGYAVTLLPDTLVTRRQEDLEATIQDLTALGARLPPEAAGP